MTDPNAPAFSIDEKHRGMTKREYFTARAMEGLLAYKQDMESEHLTTYALLIADLQIAKLNNVNLIDQHEEDEQQKEAV